MAKAQRQADLFSGEPAMPEGFDYRQEVISTDEERHFAAWFAQLPLAPFEFHGFLGRRRIVSFGWRYDYAGRQIRPSADIPEILLPLRQRAADVVGLAAGSLQQVLVTEYGPGAPIGWHRDKPMFEEIVAISFLAPCLLRFRRRLRDSWERRSLEVMPRSAYVLSGAARNDWEHSIPPLSALRYSVTFRSLRDA
ncbi:alpha-ketoglutarate-dependent dioxygenase AlkB [Reyranella soli]|uniref:2OG-Fe(II) oxygenase n=1 Tax=Reyranella soli TaxID=1230389 RepID=A0A512N2Y2_9HYPH|nr:alpha-ketoglutarate-dependent dioxygenase AlkB [Reyranella soli]GEP53332.1 2OG-Fe(II) oxygenase [Reyranella soli]